MARHRSGRVPRLTFRTSLDRRAAGEPVAYIRGIKEFHGIALAVDRRALIPRPETEHVVDLVLADVMARLAARAGAGVAEPLRVIDVGTGSGAIAIALAVALRARRVPLEEVLIDAVDDSAEALDLARENAVGHAVGDRVTFQEADLLPARPESRTWDVVAANLPYVRSDAMASLPAPTTFEPARALDGGPDGAVRDRAAARPAAGRARNRWRCVPRDRRGPGRGHRRARCGAPAWLVVPRRDPTLRGCRGRLSCAGVRRERPAAIVR